MTKDAVLTIKNVCQIRTRYAETDKMGFIYNGEYLTYFEVARVELMRSIGFPYSKLEEAGYELPLLEARVKYLNAARFDDLLNVEAKLDFKFAPTFDIEYNITRDKTTIAKGTTTHCFFSIAKQKATRPPKVFIDAIAKAAKGSL